MSLDLKEFKGLDKGLEKPEDEGPESTDESTDKGPEDGESLDQDKKPQEEDEESVEQVVISNVGDYLRMLERAIEENEKDEISKHKFVQVTSVLSSLGLDPDETEILPSAALPGAAAYFDTEREVVGVIWEFVSHPELKTADLYKALKHESIHASGIHDEGLTQIKTNQEASGDLDAYVDEQQENKEVFRNLGIAKALDLYDIKNPKPLIEAFLKVELQLMLEELMKDEIKEGLERDKGVEAVTESPEFIKKVRDLLGDLEGAVPRLHDKAESQAIDFERISKEVCKDVLGKKEALGIFVA